MGNLHYLYIPTRNWYIQYIHWNENVSHCVYHRELPFLQGNSLTIPLRFFVNCYIRTNISSTQLFITHAYTHIKTWTHHQRFNFWLSNEEFGCLNHLKYLNKWQKLTSEKKGQVENSYKQLESKHVPFTSINIFFCNFLLRLNVKHL